MDMEDRTKNVEEKILEIEMRVEDRLWKIEEQRKSLVSKIEEQIEGWKRR